MRSLLPFASTLATRIFGIQCSDGPYDIPGACNDGCNASSPAQYVAGNWSGVWKHLGWEEEDTTPCRFGFWPRGEFRLRRAEGVQHRTLVAFEGRHMRNSTSGVVFDELRRFDVNTMSKERFERLPLFSAQQP